EYGRGALLSSATDNEVQLKGVAESVMVSCQKDEGVECLTLRVGSAVLLQGDIGEIGVDGIRSERPDGFAKAAESEVSESTNPAEVGFLGRGLVSAGAAQPSRLLEEN